jgi:glycosyltransferase involved in cell wall biosynthesis
VEEFERTLVDADVVIVHQCLSAFGLFLASHARLAGKLVIGMDHGGGEHPLVNHTAESCLMYHRFLAQSEFAVRAFHDLNVPAKIILGPVDTTYYCPSEGDEREKGLIVAVGRILPHKGFDRIIRALPKGLKLVIAGTVCDQAYSSMLAELIQSSGSDVVILEGLDDDDIRNLVRKASLFVHASTHVDYRGTYYAKPELLGLAPLEALACGTPTLVSNAGSLPELGAIVGCDVFFSDDDLKKSLASFANGVVSSPPSSIYESVRKLYGIEQYGEKLLAELIAMGEAA